MAHTKLFSGTQISFPGTFICIEGPDGSGKSTQLKLLQQELVRQGFDVVVAREPGGTECGQEIRRVFLEGQGKLTPTAEVLLLLAAKSQVLSEVVIPSLAAGKIVLMDRYTDSLFAYQGGARSLGIYFIREIVEAAGLSFKPDLTFFVDTPLGECMKRLRQRGEGDINAIDLAGDFYHRKVHAAYRELYQHRLRSFDTTLCQLDGTEEVQTIADLIAARAVSAIQSHLEERTRRVNELS